MSLKTPSSRTSGIRLGMRVRRVSILGGKDEEFQYQVIGVLGAEPKYGLPEPVLVDQAQ